MDTIASMQNILVIGAHFDDAELGCGGTMARLAAEGKNVYKLTLTDNRTDFTQMNISIDFEDSRRDSAKACAVLGVNEITDFEAVPCNKLEYCSEVMQRIEKIIYDKKIDTVFCHFGSDMNQDHVAASKLSITAARHCGTILCYQSNGYVLDNSFYPTVFIDISGQYKLKEDALACYRSDHNRNGRLFGVSLKRAEIWGFATETDYAEGFVPVKLTL